VGNSRVPLSKGVLILTLDIEGQASCVAAHSRRRCPSFHCGEKTTSNLTTRQSTRIYYACLLRCRIHWDGFHDIA
jgi:hypothetical protein